MKLKTTIKLIAGILIITILSCCFFLFSGAVDDDFQAVLDQFPESYHSYLIELHELYPNWEFEAMETGLDWYDTIEVQSASNKSLVTNTSGYSDYFKSTASGDYNSTTDTYIEKDSGFVSANEVAVSYYMDPRNFLTVQGIFQFEDLSFSDSFTVTDVELVLTGSFMNYTTVEYYDTSGKLVTTSSTYAELIYNAGKTYDINPCYLASKILNEVGSTGSGSVSGTYSGYAGIYNFYNIGAYDGTDAIANGLSWASSGTTYSRPWTSPEASIFGGAEYIASNYIAKGQYTGYLQRFNVNPDSDYSVNTHQYMTNISGAASQGYTNYLSYLASGSLSDKYVFSIPVFENMSATASGEGDISLYDSTVQYATVSASSTNVRTGPSTSNSSLGFTISSGTQVEILDIVFTDTTYYLNVLKYPFWANIQFTIDSTTYTGYVPMDFLEISSYTCVNYGTVDLGAFTSSADVDVNYYSFDSSIAQVNDDNTITFLKSGTVTILAYDSNKKVDIYNYKVTSAASSREITSLKASVSGTGLVVTYDENTNVDYYEVFVMNKYGYEIFSTTLTGTKTTFDFTNIADASIVLVRGVRTLSSSVNSYGTFATYSLSTINSLPITQVKISSISPSYTSATLKWSTVENADGYSIYQEIDGVYTQIDTVYGGSVTTYVAKNLSSSTKYSFKVKAFSQDSEGIILWGTASDSIETTTLSTKVQMTTYSKTYDAVRINWEEISVADGYRVYQLIDGTWTSVATVYGSDTLTYRISGLNRGTQYSFAVAAFIRDDSGTAIFQEISSAFVTETLCSKVQMTTYTRTYDAIRINWEEIAVADGYRVYQLIDETWTKVATVYGSDTLTYRISGLQRSTQYSFAVAAFIRDDSGTAIFQELSDAFVAETVSTQVQLTTYTRTYDAIRINWDEIPIADGYRVYQLIDGTYTSIATLYGSDVLTYRVSSLDANTEYSFKVKAFYWNSDGSTNWQEASEAYSASTRTEQTQLTTYTRTYDAIRLNWLEVDDADGYRVYQLINGEWTKITTLYGSDSLTYRVSGLNANTEYSFKVNAFIRNSAGTAVFLDSSDIYLASTKTEQVQMTTYSKTSSAVRINWEELSGVDGYRVYQLIDGEWTKIATVYGEDATTYRISGLKSSTTYKFKVCAFVRNSNGTAYFLDDSATFSATTN